MKRQRFFLIEKPSRLLAVCCGDPLRRFRGFVIEAVTHAPSTGQYLLHVCVPAREVDTRYMGVPALKNTVGLVPAPPAHRAR